MFAFKGGKGTLHAGVVKKVQISWWQSEKWGGADEQWQVSDRKKHRTALHLAESDVWCNNSTVIVLGSYVLFHRGLT